MINKLNGFIFLFLKYKSAEVEMTLEGISIFTFLASHQEQSNMSLLTETSTYNLPLLMHTILKVYSRGI